MSYDFALLKACEHKVFFETAELDPSRNLVKFLRPPSNARTIQLFIDDLEIPRSGAFSTARLPFSKPEPYLIKSNVNDLLYLKIGSDIPRIIQLITGQNFKAKDLVIDLQKKIPELNIYVTNGHVVFETKQAGVLENFSFPDPRWTDPTSSLPSTTKILAAFDELGILPGRIARGAKLFPGWSIIQNPDSEDQSDKAILFESPILNSEPLIYLNYITVAANCRRCHGTRIEFDYNIIGGTYEIVVNTDLLAQELDKFVFTRLGSHWRWPWIGSKIIDRVGSKGSTVRGSVNAIINIDITQAFQVYQNIKMQQDRDFPTQLVTDAEYPYALDNVNIQSPPNDPTVAIVNAVVISRSRKPIELTRVVNIPGPANLLYGDPFSQIVSEQQRRFLLRG